MPSPLCTALRGLPALPLGRTSQSGRSLLTADLRCCLVSVCVQVAKNFMDLPKIKVRRRQGSGGRGLSMGGGRPAQRGPLQHAAGGGWSAALYLWALDAHFPTPVRGCRCP